MIGNTKACLNPSRTGKVDLVGAGCGDVSWLTVAARERIEQADVLVYDDLVDPSIIRLFQGKEQFARGKRGHLPSAKQQEITELLIEKALQGNHVVRLKGGDPMIFGRGMEEIEALEAEGIPVRVFPGISSFYGVPSKELFSLTKRNKAASFMVLTGHHAKDAKSDHDWNAIANFEGARVFLMGLSRVKWIADHLMEAGMDPDTPSAIITSPRFTLTQSVKAPLKDLADQAFKHELRSPGLILVGGSVADYQPLNAKRLGIYGTEDFYRTIQSLCPVELQTVWMDRLEAVPLEFDLKAALKTQPDWIVLTSRNGVRLFLESLKKEQIDLRHLHSRIAVLGQAEADELAKAGLFADLISSAPNSKTLAEHLIHSLQTGESVLLLQSEQALPILKDRLEEAGYPVTFLPLYSLEVFPENEADVDVSLFASRTSIQDCLKRKDPHTLGQIICISEDCKKQFPQSIQSEILVSQTASFPSLFETVIDWMNANNKRCE